MEPILFYKTRGPYGCFSNFSRDHVTIFGRTWPTSEHAFQAMKYYPHRPDLVTKVFQANLPSEAADIGRDRSNPLHPMWDLDVEGCMPPCSPAKDIFLMRVDDGRGADDVVKVYKDAIMYVVVLAKFTQDPSLTDILVGTGSAPIIEDTRTSGDSYWGCGTDGAGHNRLGKILMGVREILRTRRTHADTILSRLVGDLGLRRQDIDPILTA